LSVGAAWHDVVQGVVGGVEPESEGVTEDEFLVELNMDLYGYLRKLESMEASIDASGCYPEKLLPADFHEALKWM